MYMSCTEPAVKEEIICAFTRQSTLRVVIATVSFGIGIDCPDIRQVIHVGSLSDMEDVCVVMFAGLFVAVVTVPPICIHLYSSEQISGVFFSFFLNIIINIVLFATLLVMIRS